MYNSEKQQIANEIDELISSKGISKTKKDKLRGIKKKLLATNDPGFILQLAEKLVKIISTPSRLYTFYRFLKKIWDWLKEL